MVASSDLVIWYNEHINTKIIPQPPSTNENGVVLTQTQDKPSTKPSTPTQTSEPAAPTPAEPAPAQTHQLKTTTTIKY